MFPHVERFVQHPWYGHVPKVTERWVDICSPADDPTAAERMPDLQKPDKSKLNQCREKYGPVPGQTPHKISKACENKYTDQSILNYVYSAHHLLNDSFNDNRYFDIHKSHIIHFVGETKPWVQGRDHHHTSQGRANATRIWQRHCSAHSTGHVVNAQTSTHGHGHAGSRENLSSLRSILSRAEERAQGVPAANHGEWLQRTWLGDRQWNSGHDSGV